ncbi:MAG: hypothetical protein QNJ92_03980 [Alphaproteobacteria bacterium]|nr:hypothetical protein [Alphaproteobacteria bacterium]
MRLTPIALSAALMLATVPVAADDSIHESAIVGGVNGAAMGAFAGVGSSIGTGAGAGIGLALGLGIGAIAAWQRSLLRGKYPPEAHITGPEDGGYGAYWGTSQGGYAKLAPPNWAYPRP